MRDALITELEKFGYPVRMQGSLSPSESYPPAFFTIWNDDSESIAHYDNDARAYTWTFSVYFYASDPALVVSVPLDAIAALKNSGWIIDGRGYDIASDEITHTGRAFDCTYIERPGIN